MKLNQWHKATASNNNGSCVEVMETTEGFLVRDTKDHGDGPTLSFTRSEWAAFRDGMLKGEFDPAE